MDGVQVRPQDQVRKREVRLTPDQRERLEEIVRNGRSPAKKITQAVGLHRNTVARIRWNFVPR